MKFGTGARSGMENKNARINPGPGAHEPDYKVGKNRSQLIETYIFMTCKTHLGALVFEELE